MKDILLIICTVAGGLGCFLLGMKHLSEGLQGVGGAGLRRFMALATTHRLAGVGTGIVSTLIVQSSSIITVMLVGFVSSGLMTLTQAINVIIGANIGTTGTVWIVAFAPDPQVLGLVGLALGGLFYFFVGRERWHDLGLAVLGLGLVFLGLYFMAKGVMPIRQNPQIQSAFTRMCAGEATFGMVVLVALVAALFTAVIQSSAASIAIGMTLASQQLITFEMAIAVLFGANIGTTMTAWLAAIGNTADARRTALAHTLQNLIGSILFLPLILPVFVPLAKTLFPNWNTVTQVTQGGVQVPMLLKVMVPIAVTDTIFSVLRGVLFFPFVKPFARLVERCIPQPENEKPHLSALSLSAKLSPVIACDQALNEVWFMRDSDSELLHIVRRVLEGTATDEEESHIIHREDVLDNVQKEVTEFLGSIMAKRLSVPVAERARRLLRLTDELESVSDEAAKVLKVIHRLRHAKQDMSAASRTTLLGIHDRIEAFAARITPLIASPRPPFNLAELQALSHELHEAVRTARQAQLGRVGPDDPSSPLRVLVELDVLNAYERIRAYYLNIAETLAGGKRQD